MPSSSAKVQVLSTWLQSSNDSGKSQVQDQIWYNFTKHAHFQFILLCTKFPEPVLQLCDCARVWQLEFTTELNKAHFLNIVTGGMNESGLH